MKSDAIAGAVQAVTKKWAKQRKAEERNSSARSRRSYYSSRVNFSDVADKILPRAYMHASGNGKYTVSQRQLYYASREAFYEATGRHIDQAYFTQTILRKYLNTYDVDWKITADPRGTFIIPNASSDTRIAMSKTSRNARSTSSREKAGRGDLKGECNCWRVHHQPFAFVCLPSRQF